MQRTIRIQLEPSPAQAQALAETCRQFTGVFNAVCTLGWQLALSNTIKLHHATYYQLKVDYPQLVSDLHIQARIKASEALRSALALRKRGRTVSQPRAAACPPRYNRHTFRLDWQHRSVRLSLVGGRETIGFRLPGYAAKYAGYPTATADLICHKRRWWLHLTISLPKPEIAATGQAVGIDLGLTCPAVTSSNYFLGKRAWKAVEGRLLHLKRALQKKGSRSAKRHLKRVRHKQARFRRDCDHQLSRQLVSAVEAGTTLVLENLSGIRGRIKARRKTPTKRRLHSWSFAQLRAFIEYKAEERGCMVVAVAPQHTSQRCSCCGHTARTNRRSRELFVCRVCGFSLHADLNAARNIAAKYHVESGRATFDRLPVNQPIVSSRTRRRSG
jgi:putative transposase